jgi:hypothetical protein
MPFGLRSPLANTFSPEPSGLISRMFARRISSPMPYSPTLLAEPTET